MEVVISFSYPKKFKIGAKLISLFINRPYSHVLIHWYSKSLDRTLVYQASHGQVHFIEMQNFLKDNDIVKSYKVNLLDDQYNELIRRCVDLAGQPYATMELLKLSIHEILAKVNIKCDFNDTKGYICSELMADILETMYGKVFKKPKNQITPSDIDDFLGKKSI